MSDAQDDLSFETRLDAPVEKVWRALTISAYLERWLRLEGEVDLDLVAADEPHSVTYRWRERGGEDGAGRDSFVTFELAPFGQESTWFRLTHRPVVLPVPANENQTTCLMAA